MTPRSSTASSSPPKTLPKSFPKGLARLPPGPATPIPPTGAGRHTSASKRYGSLRTRAAVGGVAPSHPTSARRFTVRSTCFPHSRPAIVSLSLLRQHVELLHHFLDRLSVRLFVALHRHLEDAVQD